MHARPLQQIDIDDFPTLNEIRTAHDRLKDVVIRTPLDKNVNLSQRYHGDIHLKREDLQKVRSYKIRGAYNKISTLSRHAARAGIVCASAGNHAQGVAYACAALEISGTIFMPQPTPMQKINQVKMFGGNVVDVILVGDTFDDAYQEAALFADKHKRELIHPFDDRKIIEGQGTIGLEIVEDLPDPIDYLLVPIGGGGLASGVSIVFNRLSPGTRIVGVEPKGAPAMQASLKKDGIVTLDKIDKFVDGAAVQRVGDATFRICRQLLDDVITVDEGEVCSTILKLYNEEGMVVEPAGALTIAALRMLENDIKGKRVVCIVSGSNNDITRMEEIKERSLLFEGLKHYFIVRFPQRAGALKEFVTHVLGPTDDITHFEYSKKNSRERGPALVGIELRNAADYHSLIERFNQYGFVFEYLNKSSDLFHYLI
ncbi:MAG: threonine ammonia-lyase IlvA [Desulfobacteraceae bacterium]|nr:threonine ammonia-lyase IlvA [Desulfobacteraceae bacterium]